MEYAQKGDKAWLSCIVEDSVVVVSMKWCFVPVSKTFLKLTNLRVVNLF